jgi:hypothetical protein
LLPQHGLVEQREVTKAHSTFTLRCSQLRPPLPVDLMVINGAAPPVVCNVGLHFLAHRGRQFEAAHRVCRNSLGIGLQQYFLASAAHIVRAPAMDEAPNSICRVVKGSIRNLAHCSRQAQIFLPQSFQSKGNP